MQVFSTTKACESTKAFKAFYIENNNEKLETS
jgi:hypothetical protein